MVEEELTVQPGVPTNENAVGFENATVDWGELVAKFAPEIINVTFEAPGSKCDGLTPVIVGPVEMVKVSVVVVPSEFVIVKGTDSTDAEDATSILATIEVGDTTVQAVSGDTGDVELLVPVNVMPEAAGNDPIAPAAKPVPVMVMLSPDVPGAAADGVNADIAKVVTSANG